MSKGAPLLEFHEGRKDGPYKDSEGYWSIGVGRCIDRRVGCSVPEGMKLPLLPAEIDALFAVDLAAHVALVNKYAPWAAALDEVRFHVVLEMFYNMGGEPFDNDGYKDWPNFIAQVKAGNNAAAATNMRGTLWCKQIGARGTRLALMMETGKWPNEPGVPRIV